MLNTFPMLLHVFVQTSLIDYSEMVHESYEWLHSIYGDIEEELPLDMPIPLGKSSKHFCSSTPIYITI